jgi:hypothetical protein
MSGCGFGILHGFLFQLPTRRAFACSSRQIVKGRRDVVVVCSSSKESTSDTRVGKLEAVAWKRSWMNLGKGMLGNVDTMEDDVFNEHVSQSSLLTCAFNQDGGCLAIGTTAGFSVHNLHPQYGMTVNRQLDGIGLVEMLFRCNLMALVGGGSSPQAPPHRVLIWDDHIPKEVGELSFRQVVLRVRLRKDAIAVALRDRVYVYHLADLSLRDKIYTADNLHGLLCLSTQIQDMVLACPSVTPGHVRVELYNLRKTVVRRCLVWYECGFFWCLLAQRRHSLCTFCISLLC